jgi:hypothetical protein
MRRASLFIAASWTGLGALVLTAVAAIAEAPLALTVPTLLLVIASSYVMLATRRADEYTEGLWNAGASVAFGTMLITFLGLPFAEGLYDGTTGADDSRDIPATVVSVLAIAAFYIGLFIKRLLGDA